MVTGKLLIPLAFVPNIQQYIYGKLIALYNGTSSELCEKIWYYVTIAMTCAAYPQTMHYIIQNITKL